MTEWAGIALSSIANNTPFSCTRFEGLTPVLTEHVLKGHTPTEIVKNIANIFPPLDDGEKTRFAISYPISLLEEQRERFYEAQDYTEDHCTTFLKRCRFNVKQSIDHADCLFLDLTPGQVAAKRVRGRIVDGFWQFGGCKTTGLTILGGVDSISLEDVIEKLILPTVESLDTVRCVAVLKPDNTFPNLATWDLNYHFFDIPVVYLSIADLSYEAACMMESLDPAHFECGYETDAELTLDTLSIELSDGQSICLLPFCSTLPANRSFYFTTSKDDQTTATLHFRKDGISCGKAILEDLIPKMRGATRIKVVVQCDDSQHTSVTIQGLGSSEKKVILLEDVYASNSFTASKEYKELKPLVLGIDGVIGELPE
ncbi:hypothetical protein CPB86DRAFT_238067 [Serendipita vermifera]|nr:hypothetical protein CPB86DRAFT_238067 [Serendipita vermifera]